MAGHFPWVFFELADAQRDLLLVLLDAQNNCLNFFANAQHFTRLGNALRPGKLGYVDQAFDTFFDFNKGTIWHEVDHFSVDRRADRIFLLNPFPRIV